MELQKEFLHVNKRNRFNTEVAVYSFNFETILNLLLKVAKCTCKDSLQDIHLSEQHILFFSLFFLSFSQIMLCANFNYELEHKSQNIDNFIITELLCKRKIVKTFLIHQLLAAHYCEIAV